MHIYDYIIIGSGLTGLTIAKKISQETDNILILEAQDHAGGTNRPVSFHTQTINNGLRHIPASEVSRKSLNFLQDLLNQELRLEAQDNSVETYEANGFKKFVGFGENPPEFYDQLSYFISPEKVVLSSQPHSWLTELSETLQNKIQNRSIVTRFGFEKLETDRPALTHVIVNGNKNIYGRNFIFAGPIKDLHLLLPDEVFSARAKAKLKKSKSWQAVCIDLLHAPVTESESLFLLNGTTDDDIGPCVGQFLPSAPPAQVSQWLSFIDSESAEDTENIGLVLKKIKRQIKRAFPALSETITKERISVSPVLSGAEIKVNANGTFPQAENLWLASAQLNPYPNLLGSLMQSQFILSSLGFGSTEIQMGQNNSRAEAELSI